MRRAWPIIVMMIVIVIGWFNEDIAEQRISKPTIIAHRGLSAEAPENTLTAFQQAVAVGCDFIELDVQLCADGVPVVIHDATVKRTTDAGEETPVSALSLSELKALDAGGWFSQQYRGESIPTLEEVLMSVPSSVGVFVEIKVPDSADKELVPAVLAVIDKVQAARSPGPIIIGSFSPAIVEEVIAQRPNHPVLGIAQDQKTLQQHLTLGITHLVLNEAMINTTLMQYLQQNNALTWVYTVDDPDHYLTLAAEGVDGFITNRADKIKATQL